MPYNPDTLGTAPGSYTARGGETLSAVALQLWGDASLWYKLAEANGLSGAETLATGRALRVPSGVTRSHHNASTFQPYDPNSVLGADFSYFAATPGGRTGRPGCGVFGQILVAIVSAAVSIALPGGGGILGAAINGMLGSTAGQLFGLATGIQDKFNFGSVAMAGIAAGVTAGLSGPGAFKELSKVTGRGMSVFEKIGIGGGVLAQAAQGVIGNALTQGASMAVGLQNKLDFAGVAASGVGQGLSSQIKLGGFGGRLARAGADGMASAATRGLITGTGFGDNIIAVLPSVIGRTVGGWISDQIAAARQSPVDDAVDGLLSTVSASGGMLGGGGWDGISRRPAGAFHNVGMRDPGQYPGDDEIPMSHAQNASIKERALAWIEKDAPPEYRDAWSQLARDRFNRAEKYLDDELNRSLASFDLTPGQLPTVTRDSGSYSTGQPIDTSRASRLWALTYSDFARKDAQGRDLAAGAPSSLNGPSVRAYTAEMALAQWQGRRTAAWLNSTSTGLFDLKTHSYLAGASLEQMEAVQELDAALAGIGGARAVSGRVRTPTTTRPVSIPRPSWRTSELDVGAGIRGQGYRAQVSFKDGYEVRYGTKGSVRPEYYNPGNGIEVKNYNVETARGRAKLVRDVSVQVIGRVGSLPEGTAQSVYIDVRGQSVSRSDLKAMVNRIVQRSNGALHPSNINIVR
jgi:hypothetical protein